MIHTHTCTHTNRHAHTCTLTRTHTRALPLPLGGKVTPTIYLAMSIDMFPSYKIILYYNSNNVQFCVRVIITFNYLSAQCVCLYVPANVIPLIFNFEGNIFGPHEKAYSIMLMCTHNVCMCTHNDINVLLYWNIFGPKEIGKRDRIYICTV